MNPLKWWVFRPQFNKPSKLSGQRILIWFFLDIKLGSNEQGAFDILKELMNFNFEIIYTTSSRYTEDILQALNKFGAKKYLLKPLDIDEVVEAVELAKEVLNPEVVLNQIEDIRKLLNNFNTAESTQRLKLPLKNGFQYISREDIIMLRSNVNSTLIFLCNNGSISTSKNLKYFESILTDQKFIRVSKSYIVNVDHVEKYSTEEGGTVFLKNDCQATLSNPYRGHFFNALGE